MRGKIINVKRLAQLIDKFQMSDKKEQLNDYIICVVTDCARLCTAGLNIRVLNEFKFMVENLRKELEL
ncbi:MAG: hypothetical protein K2N33_02465 [Clostridia bacterium]|nr:hypothetical protein [Clostridia bacterium]